MWSQTRGLLSLSVCHKTKCVEPPLAAKLPPTQIVSSQAHPTNGQTLAVFLCVSSASAQLQSSGLRATTPLSSLVHYVHIRQSRKIV